MACYSCQFSWSDQSLFLRSSAQFRGVLVHLFIICFTSVASLQPLQFTLFNVFFNILGFASPFLAFFTSFSICWSNLFLYDFSSFSWRFNLVDIRLISFRTKIIISFPSFAHVAGWYTISLDSCSSDSSIVCPPFLSQMLFVTFRSPVPTHRNWLIRRSNPSFLNKYYCLEKKSCNFVGDFYQFCLACGFALPLFRF